MTEEAIEKLVDFLIKTRGIHGALKRIHDMHNEKRIDSRVTVRLQQLILEKEKKS